MSSETVSGFMGSDEDLILYLDTRIRNLPEYPSLMPDIETLLREVERRLAAYRRGDLT